MGASLLPPNSKRALRGSAAQRIAPVVAQEAARALSQAQLKPDPALAAAGWERRFTVDAHRAQEAVALYEQLGYEVRAVPVRPVELGDDCEDCRLVVVFQFKTIYTRKQPAAKGATE